MDRIRFRARELRHNPTDAERGSVETTSVLAASRVQIPSSATYLGNYIVDFVCLEKRVVVEVDGGQHGDQVDAQRDSWLRDEGFVVLRFWNHEVLNNMDAVKEMILQNLQNTPFLSPSPQGGRKKSRQSGSANN